MNVRPLYLIWAILIAVISAELYATAKLEEYVQQQQQLTADAEPDALPPGGPKSIEDLDTAPNLAPLSFDSIQEAAVYGAQMSYDFTDQYESGGVILKDKHGKYWITRPYTINSNDSMLINHIEKYMGYTTVGDFHTHPCLPYTHFPDYFSNPDIAFILYWNETGYVTNFCNGHVYQFIAGQDKPGNAFILDIHQSLTHGHQVGIIPLTKSPIIKELPPAFDALAGEFNGQ